MFSAAQISKVRHFIDIVSFPSRSLFPVSTTPYHYRYSPIPRVRRPDLCPPLAVICNIVEPICVPVPRVVATLHSCYSNFRGMLLDLRARRSQWMPANIALIVRYCIILSISYVRSSTSLINRSHTELTLTRRTQHNQCTLIIIAPRDRGTEQTPTQLNQRSRKAASAGIMGLSLQASRSAA
jgi:hypothetical protein